MARSKTGPFYITQPITMSSTTSEQIALLDLGVYVDPADKQGIMITRAEFIYQNSSTFMPNSFAANSQVKIEVHDAVLGELAGANNYHLVASSALTTDAQKNPSMVQDIWPDRFGIGKNEGRIVVNDELEIVGKASASLANLECVVKLTCKVVTLTNKDFMSLALQTVAN